MADQEIRTAAAKVPVPEVGPTPFTKPRPLGDCRVAIVTTAALAMGVHGAPRGGAPGFQVIPAGSRVQLMHESPNFDRSGWLADPNVVFPVDRLRELAADRVIGSVAPRHISFAGNQQLPTLSELDLDAGPAAAELLARDQVDVVLLTPV